MTARWCDGCLMAGLHVPATTRSLNPEYARYAFCEDCARKYNAVLLEEIRDKKTLKTVWSPMNYPSRRGGREVFKIKYGGKHYAGCVCDICGALDGNHTLMCTCPYCGGKAGEHHEDCRCPQCFKPKGNHDPHCECPVCHRLG